MSRPTNNSISRFVAACAGRVHIGPQTKVLDAPCGFGRHAYWFAAHGCNVVGIDLDPSRIEAAARGMPAMEQQISWHVADIEQTTPLFDATFDILVCVHYFSDGIIQQAARALKPGGHFIFETFGGQGQNWLSLPTRGWGERAVNDDFRIMQLKERLVGPDRTHVVVQLLAERMS